MVNGRWLALGAAVSLVACATPSSNAQPYERYTLGNGLEVLIWPNKNSESRDEVEMNLLIKAGSEDEGPDQAGLAHFVEHMAFEQKDAMGNNPIDSWLDQLKLDTSAHANAFTSYDRTDYYLHFKDTSAERLQIGVNLLSHYAQDTSFYTDEVEQEKPIIKGEWRYRQNNETAAEKLNNADLEGHPWLKHPPIGDMDVVANATVQKLTEFYQTHYRPDNALLVVTGDVDLNILKQQIDTAFSQWKKPSTPYQATSTPQQTPSATIHKLQATDITGSRVLLEGFRQDWIIHNDDDQRNYAIIDAIFATLQQRLDKAMQSHQLTMDLAAYYGYHPSDRLLGNFVFDVSGNTADLQKSLSLLSLEWARMALHGLTQEELDSWRNTVLQKEKNNQDSAIHLANMSVDALMSGGRLQGQDQYYALLKRELPKLTTTEVQDVAANILTFTPRITLIQNPAEPTPSDEQLRQWSQWPAEVDASATLKNQTEQWTVHKQPSTITAHETLENGIQVYTLSNGIKVYYSRLKTDADQVYIQFVGNGGLNRLTDKEALVTRLALGVMAASGLRDMDGQALNHWLDERNLTLHPYFTYNSRELELKGPTTQIESLLRLAHIALTEARVDPQILDYYKQSNAAYLQKLGTSNRDVFDRQVEAVLYQNDSRLRRMTVDEINGISKADIEGIYQHYYSGAQNYQIYMVGDFSVAELEQQLVRYVANIPPHSPNFQATTSLPKLQKSEQVTGQGIGGKATFITLMYELDKTQLPWVNNSLLRAETDRLSEQLTTTIREQLGLTYSVQASFSGATTLDNAVRMQIDLSVAPDQVDNAITAINAEINKRATATISQDEIDQQLKKHRQSYADDIDNMNRMMLMARASMLDRPMASILDADASVASYQPQQVNQLYQMLMGSKARHLEFVLNP